MTIQEKLDTLRHGLDGCALTAFGDLSSGLILRTSSDRKIPREKLDELCSIAERSFALRDNMATIGLGRPTQDNQFTVSFCQADVNIFVRDDAEPNDVTCATINAGHCLETALLSIDSCSSDSSKAIE